MLQASRDNYLLQLREMERKIADDKIEALHQEDRIKQLQEQLRDSSAKLLSFHNLLLNGPSLQSILVSGMGAEGDQSALSESIEELHSQISHFSEFFSRISAADLLSVRSELRERLARPSQVDSTSKSKRWKKIATMDFQGQTTDFQKDLDSPCVPEKTENMDFKADAELELTNLHRSELPITRAGGASPVKGESPLAESMVAPQRPKVHLETEKDSIEKDTGNNSAAQVQPEVERPTLAGSAVESFEKSSSTLRSPTLVKTTSTLRKKIAKQKVVKDGPQGSKDSKDSLKSTAAMQETVQYEPTATEAASLRRINTLPSGGLEVANDSTNDMGHNIQRMSTLRKQVVQLQDQLASVEADYEKEKKSSSDLRASLNEGLAVWAQCKEKIGSLTAQIGVERVKSERLSERCAQLLSEISKLHEEMHKLADDKDDQINMLTSAVDELTVKLATYEKSEMKQRMIARERQFLECCERALRCMASAEATSSCSACLRRMSYPLTLVPCGHTFCEKCFLREQHRKGVALPMDAMSAIGVLHSYERSLAEFHEFEERIQRDFLSGATVSEQDLLLKRGPPKLPVGYLTKPLYVKCATNNPFYCADCEKHCATGYLVSQLLDELCGKISYVHTVVDEIQGLSKTHVIDDLTGGEPAKDGFVIADRSHKTLKTSYVDLEQRSDSGDAG
jgi:hypothetical protein